MMKETGFLDEYNQYHGVTGRPMPPIKAITPSVLAYYKMHFTDDGYPGQRMPDGRVFEHPIFPIYIINEYLAQLRVRESDTVVEALRAVADAALRRAEPYGDALVRWYEPSAMVARSCARHYSGVTQAYYASALFELAKFYADERYRDAARRFASSLTVDVAEGGVMRRHADGFGIEELPGGQVDLILNGWLSAIDVLTAEQGIAALFDPGFIEGNLALLHRLLPRYDVEALSNTRYGLAGFVYLRLVPEGGVPLHVRCPRVVGDVDHDEPILMRQSASRWQSYMFDADIDATRSRDGLSVSRGQLRMNVVLSRYWDSNAIVMVLGADRPVRARLEAFLGRYSPVHSAPVGRAWAVCDRLEIGTEPRAYRFHAPAAVMDLIGYPTNFMKKFAGRRRNVYHPIHINRLYNLYKKTGWVSFKEYAMKWTYYMNIWRNSPLYEGAIEMDHRDFVHPELAKAYPER